MTTLNTPCTVFEGHRRIAAGPLAEVALIAKHALDASAGQDRPLPVLVLADASSDVVELDWRGSEQAFGQRLRAQFGATDVDGAAAAAPSPQGASETADATPRGPGRPKLGVVAREVTLLPRHWEWLATQTGGASVALRKLVDSARREHEARDRHRQATNTAYKFMAVVAGDLPGFEEASRALFAADALRLQAHTAPWPTDVREHLFRLMAPVLGA